jgi:phosphoribosylformylglycinamidine synthase
MTCQACYDAAKAYGTPFISGKDSLHNQFTDQETGEVIKIPNTLLISAIGVIEDVRKCVTLDLKEREGILMQISAQNPSDLKELSRLHRAMAEAIKREMVSSCHDVSDGGWLTAAAEMAIAAGTGLSLEVDPSDSYFTERNGSYVIETDLMGEDALRVFFEKRGFAARKLGRTSFEPAVEVGYLENRSRKYLMHVMLDDLTKAWRGTLDW